MSTRTKRIQATAFAILIAGGAAYAAAQQQPAPPKPQTQQPAPPNPQNAGNACPQNCGCMHGEQGQHGMMGNQGHMMGGTQNGTTMDGQSGMMMGGMGEGGHCPMADMHNMADVKIENTKSGAIIRMSAKNAAQVAQIQQMAQRMTQCMGGAEPAAPKTAPPAARAH